MDRYQSSVACPKCGFYGASSKWQDFTTLLPNGNPIGCERIMRICQNCGYIWYETPLDIKKENS